MKILSIVGTRPQFIKVAPLIRALNKNRIGINNLEHCVIHTGQHYDTVMSDIFFEELEIPRPDFNLYVGSGSHGYQTGRMLIDLEKLLLEYLPDLVLVYGDTNSTLAGALAASKIHIPVAHVEAGLRSFNTGMAEENNRIVADHISNILFAPTLNAARNLKKEGLIDNVIVSGDVMLDSIIFNKGLALKKSKILKELNLLHKKYIVATIHRAENTDDPLVFFDLLNTLNLIAEKDMPVIFPVHPRSEKHIVKECWKPGPNLVMIPPVGPLDMLNLVSNAKMILTDSGGLQKEALFLNCPCVTLRDETEWVETDWCHSNIIAGRDVNNILQAVRFWHEHLNCNNISFSDKVKKYFGQGNASEVILKGISDYITSRNGKNRNGLNSWIKSVHKNEKASHTY